MISLLTAAEERAERALWIANHPVTFCRCSAGFVFCNTRLCSRELSDIAREPSAVILAELIERGRVLP